MNPIPAQANIRTHDLVARVGGAPITAGVVNIYAIAQTGDNVNKWFRGADQSWQAAEAIAVVGTHRADGHWYGSVHADCWINGVEYLEYAKETGNLHVPISYTSRCEGSCVGSGADVCTLTIQDDTAAVITDADVWISTDAAGVNVVAGTLQSDDAGQVVFMLDAGLTYYCWRQKAGINFDNPASFIAAAD